MDLISVSEDAFHDGLVAPPGAAELVSIGHSSRWDYRNNLGGGFQQKKMKLKVCAHFQVDERVCEPAGRHRSR